MNCLICSSNIKEEIYSNTFKTTYYKCSNCGFIFKDKSNYVPKSLELKVYDTHNNSISDSRYVEYFKKFIDTTIIPYINSGTVLDFGSGPSPVLKMILESDYNFEVDIYDYFYSKEKVYENKVYDLITSTEVIEHLSDPIEYFNLFNKHLKKRGYLAVMTLFTTTTDEFLNWHYMRDRTHISFYTLETLKKIASITNFEVIYSNNSRYTLFRKR